MKEERTFQLSDKEIKRVVVVRKVVEGELTQVRAAELLGLSERQVGRLTVRLRTEGECGVAHRLRGRASNRGLGEATQERVVSLYQERYQGFGPTLASEKLKELDGLVVNRETLRQWLIAEREWVPHLKSRAHRERRERKACRGELVQMDGSHHDWLEGRGPRLVLMGMIDDATGEGFGLFYDYEGTVPALDSFYHYVKKYGLPQSLYVDRHQTYQSNTAPSVEEQLEGKEPKSYFEGVMDHLEVGVIHAYSPQAKGRVERFFGTLQDRLVKELRLAGIGTREEANRFLLKYWSKFNRQFSVSARSSVDLHRPVPPEKNLKRVLSVREARVVSRDNTIQFQGKRYQIKDRWPGTPPKKIWVEDRLDGKRYLMHGDRSLRYQEVEKVPAKPKPEKSKRPASPDPSGKASGESPRRGTAVTPAADHPWRRFALRPSGKTVSQGGRIVASR